MVRAIASVVLLSVQFGVSAFGQSDQASQPASVAKAQAVLDLSTFPLVDVEEVAAANIASQSYTSKGSVEAVANRLQKAFEERGFEVEPGASITPAYATSQYRKAGFVISVMVMPGASGKTCQVTINNLGNTDVTKLPTPAGTQQLYASPRSLMCTANSSVIDTKKACRELLEANGWQWFGDTTVSFFMRQNGQRVQVMVNESPAQPGKAMIQYTAEQLSAEIPIPRELVALQYADINGGTIMDSKLGKDSFFVALRETMEKSKWKATTEQPFVIDFHEHLIFRSPAGELADCEVFEFEGMTRCRLRYMTKAQVEAESELAKKRAAEAASKQKMEAENMSVISVPTFARSEVTKRESKVIEFQLAPNAVQASLTAWTKAMEEAGWKMEKIISTKEVAELKFTKDKLAVEVTMINPGIIPASITLKATGKSKLELSEPKK